jgi:hypothetical protein
MAIMFVLFKIRQFDYLFFKHPAAFSHRMFFCILSEFFGVRSLYLSHFGGFAVCFYFHNHRPLSFFNYDLKK